MKVKTSKLTGAALDWAVAKCECVDVTIMDFDEFGYGCVLSNPDADTRFMNGSHCWSPTRYWVQGGPIIEREIGNLWKWNNLDHQCDPPVWCAVIYKKKADHILHLAAEGPTPLIAAMRCYVASKLGDEVDVPEELT